MRSKKGPSNIKIKLTLTGVFFVFATLIFLSTFFWQPKPFVATYGLMLILCWSYSLLSTRKQLAGIKMTWILPSQIFATEKCTLGSRLTAPHTSMVTVTVGDDDNAYQCVVPELRLEASSFHWPMRFMRRGWITLPPIYIESLQPFGLVSICRTMEADDSILVYPAIGNTNKKFQRRFQSQFEEGESHTPLGRDEFSHLRQYVRGDSLRHIHWKASARMGELWVSQKQALTSQTLYVYVDVSVHPTKRKHFEKLVSMAATLCKDLQPQGWHVILLGEFAHEGISGHTDRLLSSLAMIQVRSKGETHSLQQSPCLLLTTRPDQWTVSANVWVIDNASDWCEL